MSTQATVALVVVAILLVGGGIYVYQRNQAAALRASPGQQIGSGIGQLVGGIVAIATQ